LRREAVSANETARGRTSGRASATPALRPAAKPIGLGGRDEVGCVVLRALFFDRPAGRLRPVEQDSKQPLFRVSGDDKVVTRRPAHITSREPAKPSQDACAAVVLCPWAAGEKPGRQCHRRALSDAKHSTLVSPGQDVGNDLAGFWRDGGVLGRWCPWTLVPLDIGALCDRPGTKHQRSSRGRP